MAPDYSPARALLRAAEQHPSRASLVDGATDRVWSVAESADAVARLAGALRGRGLGASSRIAVIAQNSPWHFLIHVAASWIHAATVPMSPRAPAPRLREMLEAAAVDLVVVDEAGAAALADGAGVPVVAVSDIEEWSRLAPAPAGPPLPCAQEEAAVVFTSGSTGLPRPVRLSHAALWWASACFRDGFEYSPGPHVVGVCAPLSHIGGFNGTTLDTFSHGGTLVVVGPSFDPVRTLECVQRHRIAMMFVVPTMARALLEANESVGADLSSWVRPLVGGDALTPALAERMRRAGLAPIHVWGMTETGGAGAMAAPDSRAPAGSIGRPFPYVDLRIVGADGAAAGPGALGTIEVRGPGVVTGQEWLSTGDLGFVDADGWVHLVGRAHRMINTGGELVAPPRVEAALMELEEVREALVVGVPDETWGEVVGAVLVPSPGADAASLSPASLAAALGGALAPWERVRRVRPVDALPLTATGKPSPAAARELLLSGE
ncbi:long-chain fatty acid--CoA ligase [Schaalia georgiae]|nr:long-chain fatty acid--CoA ligase [Schaalia georgiae]